MCDLFIDTSSGLNIQSLPLLMFKLIGLVPTAIYGTNDGEEILKISLVLLLLTTSIWQHDNKSCHFLAE